LVWREKKRSDISHPPKEAIGYYRRGGEQMHRRIAREFVILTGIVVATAMWWAFLIAVYQ